MNDQRLPNKTIVLLGVGHTNAHIVRMWRMSPLPDTRLICVSNFRKATYSGMLPGVVAGQYTPEEMTIDLVRLCQSAGAQLVIDDVKGLDKKRSHLLFADRPPLPFDALSIGVGSVPSFGSVEVDSEAQHLLLIKPMQTFLRRFDLQLQDAVANAGNETLHVSVVGAGAGGTEVALCLPNRIRELAPHADVQMHLYGQVLNGFTSGARKSAERALVSSGAILHGDDRVISIQPNRLVTHSGESIPTNITIWATSAKAPPLLENIDLPKDDRGFLITTPSLKTPEPINVFAVGDSGTIQSEKLPKAGVYAVRQAPVLWTNLTNAVQGKPLVEYRPQRTFLKLLNTGDGRAIGEYRGFSVHSKWALKWKDYIDRKFMAMYQTYPAPMMRASSESSNEASANNSNMRCLGCGGKVGGSVLSAALKRLKINSSPEVLVGLENPDDAAVLKLPNDSAITVTTDFFASPLDDHFITGSIAALNALSDVWAMGARPVAALAIAVLPFGSDHAQEQVLTELLAGAQKELCRSGASLVGGHTIEGPRTSFGFTIVAEQQREAITKGLVTADQLLVLSKPIGSGALLAAHMQAKCSAGSMKDLQRTMLTSNQHAAELAIEAGATSLTDVTGFGLAGHLLEMLESSQVSAKIQLDAIPLLFGLEGVLANGIESTLAPSNRHVESKIEASQSDRATPEYAALFDPQTNGGMLYSISETKFEPTQGHVVIGRTIAGLPPVIRISS